ncbi:MAG: gfo/Idh/MocA family oxidoreductase [Spirochaetaceae bacterium]|nr:MAG: gfo/Idh/MocA family oxidoreductase [Spirochaetaceae bacterium]
MKTRKQSAVRWGILAPGGISRAFARELVKIPDAQVVAVGSRSAERAEAFAREFDIPKSYGSYEEFAGDPDVDIVYIGSPHSHHREHSLLCMGEGKSILCEKAFAMNARQAREMAQTARERRLFLMEAMWTRFLPTIRWVRDRITDGSIGEVKAMHATFGIKSVWDPEHRLLNPELGGGALLDTGIYPISFASMVYGMQPKTIHSSARIGSTGVDEWYSALFEYGDARSAQVSSSVQLPLRTEAVIFGTEGRIEVPQFIGAKKATIFSRSGTEETFMDNDSDRGMKHEAIEAMRCMSEGLQESPTMPIAESIEIMETLDRMRSKWNLTYPNE